MSRMNLNHKDTPAPVGTAIAQALTLWEHIFPQPKNPDERLFLCVFSGLRGADPKQLIDPQWCFHRWPGQSKEALQQLRDWARLGRETYFCAHLLKPDAKGKVRRKKEHAAPVCALWADGDGAQVPPHLPQPSAIVETSPGRHHYYWRLSRPIEPDRAEELNRRIAHAIRADLGGWDLTQLLRPPGTPNGKYAGHPTVRLVEGLSDV